MKKILLLSVYLFSFATYAQSSKIKGLGRFQIGITTIDSMYAMESTFDKPIRAISDKYEESIQETYFNSFVQLVSNDVLSEKVENAFCSNNITLFKSPMFTISGIEIIDLKLTFYKNVLIKIDCEYSEDLKDGLVLKYGKGQVKSSKSPVKCYYKLTGRTEGIYYNISTQRVWVNGAIKAVLSYQYTYNNECEPEEVSTLMIADINKLTPMMQEEIVAMKKALARSKSAKKKDVKDL